MSAAFDGIWIVWVVEGHVKHVAAHWQALAEGGSIGQLGQREGAPGEGALKDDDAIGWRMLLQNHLEGILVRHRSGDRQPGVLP